MRAMAIEEFGGPDRLKPMDRPRPRPAFGEILIHVVAAGVNPVDCQIREGLLAKLMPHEFPLVPGWDAAGVVEELGEGTSRFRKGDRVWTLARKPTQQWGCYAEYVALPEAGVAPMPARLLFEEAAAVPLAGLTAYQCLFGHGATLAPGANVLVHAAAGGVGHFAVQLARDAGANVFGTAGTANQQFVFGLGATAAIDYSREDFCDAMRRHCPDGVDLVVDTLGGEVTSRSLDLLRRGGRLVSVVDRPDADAAADRGVVAELLSTEPSAQQLSRLAHLADKKRLRPHVQKIYSLSQAAEAHEVMQSGHVRGKLVLNL